MRILIRTSRTATWARRFASIALPLAVFPIFLHRQQAIASETFGLIEVIALGLAALGFLFGIVALVRLWFTGDRGWRRAATGIVLGALCLMPVVYSVWQAGKFPLIADVATPGGEHLNLTLVRQRGETESAATGHEIQAVFPNAVARNYQSGVNDIFAEVRAEVQARGWEVVNVDEPQLERAEGQINAVEMTLLGWRDEVAIEVTGTTEFASVMMRSASLSGSADLGRNGKRIEDFLLALDARVTEAIRNAPPPDAAPIPQVFPPIIPSTPTN